MWRPGAVARVLNAFRHHGRNHTIARRSSHGVPRTLNGGVLNAFRHHGRKHYWSQAQVRIVNTSAQRLSASLKETPSSSCQINCRRERHRVLNAFRHHGRNHAERLGTNIGEKEQCSTPFGIIEGNT